VKRRARVRRVIRGPVASTSTGLAVAVAILVAALMADQFLMAFVAALMLGIGAGTGWEARGQWAAAQARMARWAKARERAR
jgi:MFS family permease